MIHLLKAEYKKSFIELKTYYPDQIVDIIIKYFLFVAFFVGFGKSQIDVGAFYIGYRVSLLDDSVIYHSGSVCQHIVRKTGRNNRTDFLKTCFCSSNPDLADVRDVQYFRFEIRYSISHSIIDTENNIYGDTGSASDFPYFYYWIYRYRDRTFRPDIIVCKNSIV